MPLSDAQVEAAARALYEVRPDSEWASCIEPFRSLFLDRARTALEAAEQCQEQEASSDDPWTDSRTRSAAFLVDAAGSPPCPYIVTGDEGTSYCRLAQSTVLRQETALMELDDDFEKAKAELAEERRATMAQSAMLTAMRAQLVEAKADLEAAHDTIRQQERELAEAKAEVARHERENYGTSHDRSSP